MRQLVGRHDYAPSGDDDTDRKRVTVEGLLNGERLAREERAVVAPQDTPLGTVSPSSSADLMGDGAAVDAARPVSSAQRLTELREAAARAAEPQEAIDPDGARTDHEAATDHTFVDGAMEPSGGERSWEPTEAVDFPEPAAVAAPTSFPEPAAAAAPTSFPEPAAAAAPTTFPEPAAVAAPTSFPEPAAVAGPTAFREPTVVPTSIDPIDDERFDGADQSEAPAWFELATDVPAVSDVAATDESGPDAVGSDDVGSDPVVSDAEVFEAEVFEAEVSENAVSEPEVASADASEHADVELDTDSWQRDAATNGSAVTDERTAALLAAEERDRMIIERARRDRERLAQQRDEEDIWTAEPTERPKGRKRRKFVPFLALLVAIGVLVAAGLFVKDLFFSDTPAADFTGTGSETVQVRVDQGDTISDIAAKLESAGVVASARAFTEAAAENPNSTSLQPGLYSLKTEMKASLALEAMLDPSAIQTITVTIPEGLTVVQTLQRLADSTGRPLEEFQAAANDWANLGVPAWFPTTAGNIEGLLQPGTYNFDPEQTSAQMVQMLVANLSNVMAQAQVEQKAPALGQTPYGILTIASLIEREAKFDDERAKMARVIYNRLAANEALGIDAATAYGLGKSGLDLTTADLNDTSNPYNLRVLTGLPPTPIANVNALSIQAALNPEAGDWKWYVVNSADGHHGFFSTYDEFLAAKDVCVQNGWC